MFNIYTIDSKSGNIKSVSIFSMIDTTDIAFVAVAVLAVIALFPG